MWEHLFDFFVIVFLIFLNGILAMTEFAIISSNNSRMKILAKKNDSAKIALELIENPGSFLSTIQIGITIIGIISGAFSGQKFAEPLGLWLNMLPWVYGYGNVIAFSIIVVFITYTSTVLGELIPKHIAISRPEKIAMLFARPVWLLSRITYPFVLILDLSAKMILKIFNHKESKEPTVTEEEIHSVIKRGVEEGTIDAFEHRVFRKVMQFGDREASVIMTPRIKVVYLDIEDKIEENYKKILQNPHRYYPVFEGSLDNFKGIIDAKEALSQKLDGNNLDLKKLIKNVPCVLEDNLGPDLLEQFKKHKTHIVVVADEYGTMQGIITLVDIFETLLGSIPESQKNETYEITTHEDGSWLCDGLMPIDEIEALLAVEIVSAFEGGSFNTLAGFLLIHFKHIPQSGEYIVWDKFRFEIVDMDANRIDKVLIKILEP